MFTCNTDITSCVVGTVADVPSSYISTSVFGVLLSQLCDIILGYMFCLYLFFPWVRSGAQRWSWTTWTQSLPRSLFSTTILRWCRRWNFLSMILTMTRMTWVMTISSGSLNAPWARWASLCAVLKENFVRSSSYSLFCDNVIVCVQIVSNRQMTRPLMLNNHRPAGHGTITVSGLIFSFVSNALAVAGAPSVWT